MALAIFFKSVVLPALGWETIMPRCPLPMGASMSISRSARSLLPSRASRRSRSSGYTGTSDSNGRRRAVFSGGSPLIWLMKIIAL